MNQKMLKLLTDLGDKSKSMEERLALGRTLEHKLRHSPHTKEIMLSIVGHSDELHILMGLACLIYQHAAKEAKESSVWKSIMAADDDARGAKNDPKALCDMLLTDLNGLPLVLSLYCALAMLFDESLDDAPETSEEGETEFYRFD